MSIPHRTLVMAKTCEVARNSPGAVTLAPSMARSLSSFGWLALCAVAVTACGPFAPVGATATASGARSPSGCYAPAVNGGAPEARSNAAFAFDIDRGAMVLFGGGTTQQPGGGFADTWTWDVQGWTKQNPPHG